MMDELAISTSEAAETETPSKVRFQVDLTPSDARALEELLASGNYRTKGEVFRAAFKLLGWFLRTNQNGETILIRSQDGKEREVVVLF